ncbi:hypothetical protein AVEN_259203-1 [Araneus ventricosus]|uniref:Uncharacterized protein n=1 Tax=Araneus ventricosus TaxID=182803 RepID=A0A4Y2GLZ0_ARAVE|nr:hypothetical protein AVEN_259203-1 [Araneus ventricosus]
MSRFWTQFHGRSLLRANLVYIKPPHFNVKWNFGYGWCQFRCLPPHLTIDQNWEIRPKPSCGTASEKKRYLTKFNLRIMCDYTMTITKSQRQTSDDVGIYLDEPVFSHGQLYVALSRPRIPNHVKIYTKTSAVQGKSLNNGKYFTRNGVYQEAF